MNILEPGHVYALYKDACGAGWVGRLSCFLQSSEFIPFVVGEEKLLLEFVIPRHLMDNTKDPQYFFIDDSKHFLMRRDYREINLYKLSDNNYMGMVRGGDSVFSSPEIGPLFISTVRKVLAYYVSKKTDTTQFIFQAEGAYASFISRALENKNDVLGRNYLVRKISDFIPPYYGFELDIISLTSKDSPEEL
uniref:hypothetical protein n=1 Tax=Serratia TaxID=613 RepID=UPI001F4C30C3|nr:MULTISPECIES: hypothetical protein [Serratia]ULG12132.1 hypothetical protein D1p2_00018 [Serratia entomophila]ULG12329.1 hypothetical protein M3p_00031 [Serratia entomophila]ULG12349.1 hypothetical protein M3p_00053 [Serratia entomophila]ULG15959.1 hypothetical protein 591p_00108 [Serratia proteamaculans]ULG18443.1 hypothetical protein Man4p_00126 [Serratia proteamaculans]